MCLCLFIGQQQSAPEPTEIASATIDRSPMANYRKRKSPDRYTSSSTDVKKHYSPDPTNDHDILYGSVPMILDEDNRIKHKSPQIDTSVYDPATRSFETLQLPPSLMSIPVTKPQVSQPSESVSALATSTANHAVREHLLQSPAYSSPLAHYLQPAASVPIPGADAVTSAAQAGLVGHHPHLVPGYLPPTVYDQQLYPYQNPYQSVAVPLVPYDIPSQAAQQVSTSRYTPSPVGSGSDSIRNILQSQINVILGEQQHRLQHDQPTQPQFRLTSPPHQPATGQLNLTATYANNTTQQPDTIDHLSPADSYALPWDSYVQRGMYKNRFPILVTNVSSTLFANLSCPYCA